MVDFTRKPAAEPKRGTDEIAQAFGPYMDASDSDIINVIVGKHCADGGEPPTDDAFTYLPSEEDLNWARTVIRVLRQGGIVGMSNGQLKLDHDNKHVTVYGVPEPWLFAAHRAVFSRLGWTVARETK